MKTRFLLRPLGLLAAALVLTGAHPAAATVYTIAAGAHSAQLDTDDADGLFTWTVSGVDQLVAHQWYYRIGSAGAESPVYALGTPTVSHGADNLSLSYASPGALQFDVRYDIDAPDSGEPWLSQIVTQVQVSNLDSSGANVSLFLYSDPSVGGTSAGDRASYDGSFTDFITVQDGPWTMGYYPFFANGPNRWQIGQAGDLVDPLTANSLTDGSPTTLTNSASPYGPGDLALAYQWNFFLAPSSLSRTDDTYSISLAQQVSAVPEPSAAWLLLVGAAALGRRLRRPRRAF